MKNYDRLKGKLQTRYLKLSVSLCSAHSGSEPHRVRELLEGVRTGRLAQGRPEARREHADQNLAANLLPF